MSSTRWFRWYKTPDGARLPLSPAPTPPAEPHTYIHIHICGAPPSRRVTPVASRTSSSVGFGPPSHVWLPVMLAGKPNNGFGHGEEALNAAKAVEVIKETNEFYNKLKAGETDAGKLSLK